MIVILIFGVAGTVFIFACPSYWCFFNSCLYLLSMRIYCTDNSFVPFYQWYLSVNSRVCQCIRPLIYYNIDVWDCWYLFVWDFSYCVLSVINTVRPVDIAFILVVSIIPFYKFSFMSIPPSVNVSLRWQIYIFIYGIVGIVFCLLFPPYFLICSLQSCW